jgi:ectoine hydroxylase
MTSLADSNVVTPMTAEQRTEFERDGFLVIPGVLNEAEVEFYADALDRVYEAQRTAGAVAPGGAMHLLSAVANCPEAVGLIDHPRVFGLVWSVLGWNVHIYHSHLDVHPPITQRQPFRDRGYR